MKIGSDILEILKILPNNLRGCNFGITDTRDFMKYRILMGPGTVIYIQSFIKIGPGIRMLLGADTYYIHTDNKVIT
jgi:hypothetical protein